MSAHVYLDKYIKISNGILLCFFTMKICTIVQCVQLLLACILDISINVYECTSYIAP